MFLGHAPSAIKALALAAGFCLLAPSPCADENGVPKAVFREWNHDMGTVPRTLLEHRFPIENKGSGVLKILYAQVPCECLDVEAPPMLMPGTSSEIVVRYDAFEAASGPFMRHVMLGTNDPEKPRVMLALRGFIQFYVQSLPLVPYVYIQAFRGESIVFNYVLHSETNPGFKLEEPKTSSPHIIATLERVTENYRKVDSKRPQFPNIIARRGDYVLSIKNSADSPSGEYRGQSVRVATNIPEQPFIEFEVDAFVRDMRH